MTQWADMHQALSDLAAADLLRDPSVVASAPGPTVTIDGRAVVCLASNDYLSLAADEALKAAAATAIERWGVGAGASRLVSGTSTLHRELEERLASFEEAEAAVVTSTGWMANHVAVHAFAGKGDLILCDKLDHASILDAARSSGATFRTYHHGDVGRLEALLKRHRGDHGRCLIVTDSLFSMDGDLAPLAKLAELKDRHDAALMVDEAHATGVLGEHGRGAAELLGVEDAVNATVGTLSKALGALGGFVVGPKVLIDLIRNTGRAYIYTTALPAAICAAALAALDIVANEPQRRRQLLAMAGDLRGRLQQGGLDTGGSASQIIPVVVGSAADALAVSGRLLEAGFFTPAIRPPTVAPGASRLRLSLCARHDPADLARLAKCLIASVSAVVSADRP
ncbi:MAG: aminotransferase class I/II-fold pyridoxal phosphate-dependent enzyme [Planctomycetota bacterium]|jgi:8-amino-7-oxononanoate synthase